MREFSDNKPPETEAVAKGDICMVLDPVEVLGNLILVYRAEEHGLAERPESPYVPDREDWLRRAGRQMIRGFSISRSEPILDNDVVLEPEETDLPGSVTVHSSIWTNFLYSGQVSKVGEINSEATDQIIKQLIKKSKEYGHIIVEEEEAHYKVGELCKASNRARWPMQEIQQNLDPIYRRNIAESTAEEGDICRIEDPESGEHHLVWVIDEDKEEGPVVHFFMAEKSEEENEDSFLVQDSTGQKYAVYPEAYGLTYGFNLKYVAHTDANVNKLTERYSPGAPVGIFNDKVSQMKEIATRIKKPIWGDD